jgi:eukaryotic-like serine/threonine-protein kinase
VSGDRVDLGDTVADSGDGSHPDEAYCSACNQSYAPEVERCPSDGTRLVRFKAQKDDMIGRVLDARFEVGLPLGKGGMGTVYRAIQVSVDREVAIKVVHPKLANDRQAAKRFLREARLASRLNQPNIVNVIDFGQTEDGVLYLVMELLRGRTIATELGGQRRFAVRRTANIALQLCDALEAAHAQGIIHRDLKPQNIVILDDPPGRDLIKVLDFGLAKSLVTDTTSAVTNTNAILGTPLYMSPEQVEGKPTDQRSDLYSLGCILYELLAGAPPFHDASVNLLLAKHVGEPAPPLPSHVPAPIRSVIERMLAKKPEARIQTAGDVRAAVQAAIDGGVFATVDAADTVPDVPSIDPALAITAAPPATASTPAAGRIATPVTAPAAAVVPEAAEPASAERRGTRGWIAVVVVVLLGAGGFAAWKLTRGDGAQTAVVVIDGAVGDAAGLPAIVVVDAAPPPPPPPAIDAEAATASIVDAAVDAKGRDRDRDRDRAKPDAATATDVTPPPPPPRKPDAEPTIDFYKKPDARPK